MLINVSALMQEPVGARRSYAFFGEEVGNAIINCQADLMRTDAGILVSAACDSEQQLTCALCLKTYSHKLRISFAEEFFPVIDITTGRKAPERDQVEDLFIDEQHHLDIADAVRQYLIMYEPQNPLCASNCAGLCPQCGVDRNTVSCKCPPKPVRSEWATLRELWAERSDD